MSKTSDIKDRLLAVSGYIRAKHVAKLLHCHPKTVLRKGYKGVEYGAVWYVLWNDVTKDLPEAVGKVLDLPGTATEALDKVRFSAVNYKPDSLPPEVVEAGLVKVAPTKLQAVQKAENALAKATALLKKNVVVSAVPNIPETVNTVEEITTLVTPVQTVTMLTIDGEIPLALDKVTSLITSALCSKCTHAMIPFHEGVGNCSFAVGTVAACKCLGA